jgi:uncharacterized protein
MYINRTLELKINKYLNKKEIIAVIGPRQCGKTTLLKHVFDKLDRALFISFEDREILEQFSDDIKLFAEKYVKNNKFLFIDEFQYAKKGGKQLKFIYDHYDIKIFISGSSAPDLTYQSMKYLVGRIFVFNLYPLTFNEYLNYKDSVLAKYLTKKSLSKTVIEKINEHHEKFTIFGGYPRVVLADDDEERIEILRNIFNLFFLREVREILQLSKDYELSKLINLLSLQISSQVNYNELSSAVGLSHKDLIKYLDILSKTFIIKTCKPFFNNKKKEIVKKPKIYFIDNGFRNIVLSNFQKLSKRPDSGSITENFVASELIKKNIEIKYWRTKSKAEVDFIIEKESRIIPIEVKLFMPKRKITKSFLSFIKKYQPKTGIILSNTKFPSKKIADSNILFYPIWGNYYDYV